MNKCVGGEGGTHEELARLNHSQSRCINLKYIVGKGTQQKHNKKSATFSPHILKRKSCPVIYLLSLPIQKLLEIVNSGSYKKAKMLVVTCLLKYDS